MPPRTNLTLTSRRHFLGGAVLTMFVGAVGPRRARAADGLVLITGVSSPVSDISRGELKRLFLGDPVVVAGQRLTAFNLPAATAERQLFEKRVLGMTPDQVAKYWIDRRIRGQGGAPKTAPSPEVLLKIAANFPGTIAYVPQGVSGPGVKILAIDGKASTDPGYLLRGST
jgi:hypothetical protein